MSTPRNPDDNTSDTPGKDKSEDLSQLERSEGSGTKDAQIRSKALAEFKRLRSATKSSLTRIKKLIIDKGDSLSLTELECRLGILESYFKQILNVSASIEQLNIPDELVLSATMRSESEEIYVATKSKILSLIAKLKPTTCDTLNQSFGIPPNFLTSQFYLQKQKLPSFAGKYSEYPNFFGLFTKLVHKNETLNDIERFNHLINCLSGPALSAIKEFDISESNYPKALKRLSDRFDNKNLIFQEHISALFEHPKVSKGSAFQLRNLVDSFNTHLNAMLSLGNHENIAHAMLVYLAMGKFDMDTQVKWQEAIDYTSLSNWADCSRILSRRCQDLEIRESKQFEETGQCRVPSNHRFRNKSRLVRNHNPTTLTVTQNSIKENSCTYCNRSGHHVSSCSEFAKLSVLDRFHQAKRLVLCLNCLVKGHSVKRCSARRCSACGQPHHFLLHRFTTDQQSTSSAFESTNSSTGASQQTSTNTSSMIGTCTSQASLIGRTITKSRGIIVLATAIVNIQDAAGQFQPIRAVLDSGSQLNFVTESMAQKLRLRRAKLNSGFNGIGEVSGMVRYKTQSVIKSRLNGYQTDVELMILPSITGVQPGRQIDIDKWQIPSNIKLADPVFNVPSQIDLLIGAELYFDLLQVGQINLGDGLPKIQKTIFGWIVSGQDRSNPNGERHCNLVEYPQAADDQSLNNLVARFWAMESIVAKTPLWTEEELECERIFVENVLQMEDGRYRVKLPIKHNHTALGHSRDIAQRRFYSMERRLDRNPSIKAQYAELLSEYESLGHMELVRHSDLHSVQYYSPHQYILRTDSSSTKLRVVFDCSCKTSSQCSLNDILMKGPVVQDDLFAIILRFRYYKYALTADISKMYRQVLVEENDAYYQCILWRDNRDDELRTYKLKTVTYGTASAPYLATRCLLHLANQHSHLYPLGANTIKKDFYIDDLITGADKLEEIDRIKCEVSNILKSAQFDLTKWYSNDISILGTIDESQRKNRFALMIQM